MESSKKISESENFLKSRGGEAGFIKKIPGLIDKLNTLKDINKASYQKFISEVRELSPSSALNNASSRSLSQIPINKTLVLNQGDDEELNIINDKIIVKDFRKMINQQSNLTNYLPNSNQILPGNIKKNNKNSQISQLSVRTMMEEELKKKNSFQENHIHSQGNKFINIILINLLYIIY